MKSSAEKKKKKKTYVTGTFSNCLNLMKQFKWVPTVYAFIKK